MFWIWGVQTSDVHHVPPGTLVQLYDATPNMQAPDSAELLGAVKSSLLQRSPTAAGGHWNVAKFTKRSKETERVFSFSELKSQNTWERNKFAN